MDVGHNNMYPHRTQVKSLERVNTTIVSHEYLHRVHAAHEVTEFFFLRVSKDVRIKVTITI